MRGGVETDFNRLRRGDIYYLSTMGLLPNLTIAPIFTIGKKDVEVYRPGKYYKARKEKREEAIGIDSEKIFFIVVFCLKNGYKASHCYA